MHFFGNDVLNLQLVIEEVLVLQLVTLGSEVESVVHVAVDLLLLSIPAE